MDSSSRDVQGSGPSFSPTTQGLGLADNNTGSSHIFHLLDFSPEWDFTAGGVKMLVTGTLEANSDSFERSMHIMFDQQEVPAQVVGPGVLRCRVPPHSAGAVGVCVTAGDGRPCSRTVTFEYRLIPEVARPQKNERGMANLADRDLQLELIQMLLHGQRQSSDRDSGGSQSSGGPSSGTSPGLRQQK
eukprot:jgi/Astpho2/660/Aster-04497